MPVSFSAIIPTISFGLFFFVLCKENLGKPKGTVSFDIQRQLFNLLVNSAICLPITILAVWFDNGSMFSSSMGSWLSIMLFVGYLVLFENQVAAALLKKRIEILAKASQDRDKKRKNT